MLASVVGGAFRCVGLVETIERDFARLRVDLEDLHLHDVAQGEDIFNLAHAAVGDAGDVEQAVLARRELHEGAEVLDADDLALEDLAKGNIDAVICDDPVAKFYANKKQEYAGKLKVAFITDDVEFYGFAVRKSDTDLVKKLNEGIKAVKEKGIDKQVVEKWIGK